MAGSGSRNWEPTTPASPCSRLSFRAPITSPKPQLLKALKVGDVLDIKLDPNPPHTVSVTSHGSPVGTLTGSDISELVRCIQNGFEYEAKVLEIRGGTCIVEVSAK